MAWLTVNYLDMDFLRIIQLLSYLGIFLILIFKREQRKIIFPGYLVFYFLFILYDFFSTIVLLGNTFQVDWLFSNRMIGAFNFIFIIENIAISKTFHKRILALCKFSFIVAVGVIIFQQVVDPQFLVRQNFEMQRVLALDDDSTRLVSIYSWIGGLVAAGFGFVPLFLYLVEDLYKKNKKVFFWLSAGLIYALFTKARWIMLNALPVFAIFLIGKEYKLFHFARMLILVPLISLMIYLFLGAAGVNVKGIVEERILEKSSKSFTESTASTRILAFEAFNRFFYEKAFLGHGDKKYGMAGTGKYDYNLRSFLGGRSSQIHVGYLSLFYIYGILGGALFMIFLVLILRNLYLMAKIHTYYSPFLGMLGLALANLTMVTFSLFEVGLIVSVFMNKYYSQISESPDEYN